MRWTDPLAWLWWPTLVAGGMAFVYRSPALGLAAPTALVVLQVVATIIVATLERWLPEHPAWNTPRRDVRADAIHAVVSGILISGALRYLIFGVVPSLGLWPTGFPVAAQVVLALVLADFGSYATHRLTHNIPWLWPIHAIHHSSRRLYWLNTYRMHPIDGASTVILSLLPLALLGAPVDVLALFDAFAIVHLLVQHSNIRLRAGPFSRLVATAEFHRWHHSDNPEEGERNFSSFLAFWDLAFGTYRMPTRALGADDVGLYGGATLADDWAGQMRHPIAQWRGKRT